MIKIASFNVENLFMRPKAFYMDTMAEGEQILDGYRAVNTLFNRTTYSAADKQQMVQLLLALDIYRRNGQGAIRKVITSTPKWAWMRKNRGAFDREPQDASKDVEIIATGRDDWIGWVELAVEPVNETATRMTAKVIKDIDADVIGIVESEDRPSLVRFNHDLMEDHYGHVMLVDGNDERGIDVGLFTRKTVDIERSARTWTRQTTSGWCSAATAPTTRCVRRAARSSTSYSNHFKSQSGGGGPKRKRQAAKVRDYVDALVAANEHVVVMGDFNEGPNGAGQQVGNLAKLFEPGSPLVSCYDVDGFDVGERPGTFDSCSITNRIDYILLSQSLASVCTGGGVFRRGLWGGRKTRPTAWETYTDMTNTAHGASDHAAVFVNLNI